ncbi:MAG: Smr/MutS family protein, partial [Treponemataceae bacterium]|nr:Smr/MutS family protein [Treponemataceae bacterium]
VKRHIADLTDATAARQSALEQAEAQLETDAVALNQRLATATTVVAENGMRITTTSGAHTGSKKKTKRRPSNAEAFARAAVPARTHDGTDKRQDSTTRAAPYAEGAEVLITATNRRGTLVRQEKDDTWLVQVGSLRMPFRQKDFVPVAPAPQAKPTVSVELAPGGENTGITPDGAAAKPVFELRLLGMRAEEAIRLLERQLDLCAMQNFRTFSVIHGKGTGVLQQAVQDYLSAYPGVQEFHFARPEDGGTGKTYVTLA